MSFQANAIEVSQTGANAAPPPAAPTSPTAAAVNPPVQAGGNQLGTGSPTSTPGQAVPGRQGATATASRGLNDVIKVSLAALNTGAPTVPVAASQPNAQIEIPTTTEAAPAVPNTVETTPVETPADAAPATPPPPSAPTDIFSLLGEDPGDDFDLLPSHGEQEPELPANLSAEDRAKIIEEFKSRPLSRKIYNHHRAYLDAKRTLESKGFSPAELPQLIESAANHQEMVESLFGLRGQEGAARWAEFHLAPAEDGSLRPGVEQLFHAIANQADKNERARDIIYKPLLKSAAEHFTAKAQIAGIDPKMAEAFATIANVIKTEFNLAEEDSPAVAKVREELTKKTQAEEAVRQQQLQQQRVNAERNYHGAIDSLLQHYAARLISNIAPENLRTVPDNSDPSFKFLDARLLSPEQRSALGIARTQLLQDLNRAVNAPENAEVKNAVLARIRLKADQGVYTPADAKAIQDMVRPLIAKWHRANGHYATSIGNVLGFNQVVKPQSGVVPVAPPSINAPTQPVMAPAPTQIQPTAPTAVPTTPPSQPPTLPNYRGMSAEQVIRASLAAMKGGH